MPQPASRTFEVRHLQLARALFAVAAALMITFSPDHSAEVGLAVFSGWAVATGLVELIAAWLVYGRGRRATIVVLGALTTVAGMVGGVPGIRTAGLFFILVITWAVATGIVELVAGIRGRGVADEARDQILAGAFALALAVALLLVNPAYSLDYFIQDAGPAGETFTLTGITIGVGLFGGYAAFVAVFLGIAGLSPRRAAPTAAGPATSVENDRTEEPAPTDSAGENA